MRFGRPILKVDQLIRRANPIDDRVVANGSRVTLKIRPHRSLEAVQKLAVEMDYGMTAGSLKIKVRKAMEGYLRDRLGLPLDGDAKALQLLECD